jgi:hypothetical protein
LRQCKHFIKDYLLFTDNLEAPSTLHFWTAIGTIAGALRGKTWIDMGHWKWKPNFFIIFVAPPGVATKSTSIGIGLDLLREIEGIHFGPDSVTWQALTDAFVDATDRFDLPGNKTLVSSSLTISASELGTFLDPRNGEMIDLMVDLWDGKEAPWKRRTRSDGESMIENPWINFIGATTPSWITENFPEYAIGGGFTSRTLFVYAETKRKLNAYPSRNMHIDNAKLRSRLVHDLTSIAAMCGEFKLTDEAFEWGTAWYSTHWGDTPEHLRGDRLGGYVARKQTHIHKTAMALSAAEGDSQFIEARHLIQADKFVTALEADMRKVFSVMGASDAGKQTSLILRIMSQARKVSKASLWRQLVTQMSHQDFENAILSLLNSGYCVLKREGPELFIIATQLLEKPAEHHDTAPETSFDQAEDSPSSQPSGA